MPQNADPMEDQFAKKANAKAENVAKNEIKRMRNIVKAKKGAIPRTGYLGPDTASSSDVSFILICLKAMNCFQFQCRMHINSQTQ